MSEGRAAAFRPRALLLDMDGVLFHGNRAIDGAREFLDEIASIPHCFVTNNPIRTPDEVVEHFVRVGLPAPSADSVITSAEATANWLAREKPGFRYFAVGAGGLGQALAKRGTADPEKADFVVVGEGEGLDFDSLTTGINLVLGRGARLVCTNPDHNVDATVDGHRIVLPGGGALVAPFTVATGVAATFIGKPHPLLYEMALARLGFGAAECVMVGDRPDTDIAGAQALGMRTALVRSGRFAPFEPLPGDIVPDWDCENLGQLLRAWEQSNKQQEKS